MKTIKTLILIAILLSQNLLFIPAVKADGSIKISKVAAFEKSDFEWIEIYNTSDTIIDLTGWKFLEDNVKHGLSAFEGGLLLEPKQSAIIADVAQNFRNSYPEYSGIIIDSSWTTLNTSGEKIGLINAGGETVELFTYASCPDAPLITFDYEVNDEEPIQDTEIPADNDYLPIAEDDYVPEIIEETNNDTADEPTENIMTINPGDILINELMPIPATGEKEWIELFNNTQNQINLDDWIIADGSNTKQYLNGLIASGEYLVIEAPKCQLNNTGDLLRLFSSDNQIIDTVTYGLWNDGHLEDNAPDSQSGQAIARFNSGWQITDSPTPDLINILFSKTEVTDQDSTGDDNNDNNNDAMSEVLKPKIIINELFPNPLGSDNNEWIELKNIGTATADLINYSLIDKEETDYKFTQTTIIAPGQFLILPKTLTHLVLNNNRNETLKLIDTNGKIIDKVSYEADFPEDLAYARDGKNWFLTITTTQGADNLITEPNKAPIIISDCPKEILINQNYICDLSDSYDPNSDEIITSWKIDDQIYNGEIINYFFDRAGDQQIKIIVTDSQLASDKLIKVKVTDPEAKTATKTSTNSKTTKTTAKTSTTTKKATTKKPATLTTSNINLALYSTATPKTNSLSEINSSLTGQVISTSGEIASKAPYKIFISDGEADLLISLKQKANIKAGDYKVGDNITVTGVIAPHTSGELAIVPRKKEDLEIIREPGKVLGETISLPANNTNSNIFNFLIIIGLTLFTAIGIIGYKSLKLKVKS